MRSWPARASARRCSRPRAGQEVERPLVGAPRRWFYMPEVGYGVIDPDVLWSCTTCGACVQPVPGRHRARRPHRRHAPLPGAGRVELPRRAQPAVQGPGGQGQPVEHVGPRRGMDWAKGLDFDVKVVGEDLESLDVGRLAVLGRLRRRLRGPRQEDDPRGGRAARTSPASPSASSATARPAPVTRRVGPATSSSSRAWPPQNVETFTGAQGQEGRHHLRPLLQHPQERVPRLRPRARGRPPHPAAQPAGPRGEADPGRLRCGAGASARSPTTTPATSAATTRSTPLRASCCRCCPARRSSRWSATPSAPSAAAPAAPGCGWRRPSATRINDQPHQGGRRHRRRPDRRRLPVLPGDALRRADRRAGHGRGPRGGRGPRRRADAAGLGQGRVGHAARGRRRGARGAPQLAARRPGPSPSRATTPRPPRRSPRPPTSGPRPRPPAAPRCSTSEAEEDDPTGRRPRAAPRCSTSSPSTTPSRRNAPGGSSLFDVHPEEATQPARASGGSSLFDVEPEHDTEPGNAPGGSSLFDVEPEQGAPAAPAETPSPGGSLFDVERGPRSPSDRAEPARARGASRPLLGSCVGRRPTHRGVPTTYTGSLFDVDEDDEPEDVGRTAETTPPEPKQQRQSSATKDVDLDEGGSLFDL